MSGDYSRDSFDALRDYAGVFLQQGRAALDADWNEMVAIFERRIRAATVDTIGRAVVPLETPLAFQIQLGAGPTLSFGRGRHYVDGLLAENHGDFDETTAVFDRARDGANGPEGVLDEPISPVAGDFVAYDAQPYWPRPTPLPEGNGPHLAYLVVWQREVTPLIEPDLLEPALGGIDTATRWQTAWQVRLLTDVGANATCATPDEQLAGWEEEIAPSTARLTTRTVDIDDPEDPCLVPPTDGYTGLENQFYRVELHSIGEEQTDGRFKFSRENASVAAAIESFGNPADRITVQRIGRDEILRFRAGDWVEVTDDRRELDHHSGQMLRVAVVNAETREIELEGTIDADLVPSGIGDDTPAIRRSRLIRWDQRGIVREADGTPWVDLDAPGSDGLIPVPPEGTALILESGITVAFSTAPQDVGGYREMDYWRFAARTAGTQIEELTNAPPDGIQRHYARLAIVTFPQSVQDCRVFWPPSFGGETESCGCTVCVTPDSHNSGQLSIQAAIDQIGPEGGTVCLAGGGYVLGAPVVIDGQVAITLQGQGAATVLFYQGAGAAIRVSGSVDVQLQRFSLLVTPGSEGPTGGAPATVAGVAARNAALLALRRLAVVVVAGNDESRQDIALALDGTAVGVKVEECLALGPVALGSLSSDGQQAAEDVPAFVAFAELRVLDTILYGARAAVRFTGLALNIAGALFERNLLLGGETGVILNWFEAPTGSTSIAASTIAAGQTALRLGVGDLRLQDNEISGGEQTGDGVLLEPNFVPEAETDAQIIGNRIADQAGAGLRVTAPMASLLVKRNVIRRCGEAGIAAVGRNTIRYAAIDNNVIEEIADSIDRSGGAGIVLARVLEGLVAGNRIRGVGLGGDAAQSYAGIALLGNAQIAVESNAISEIGPNDAALPAVGLLARLPYLTVAVRANRITGSETPGQQGQGAGWIGIQIGAASLGVAGANLAATPVPGVTASDVVFAEVGAEIYALDRFGLRAVARARERQIAASGNHLHHARDGIFPLVDIADTGDATVTFTDNQCRLEAVGQVEAIVTIVAPRIIAANNMVRRLSDRDAMHLRTGEGGDAAVLGNITFGNIRVFPGGLNPPFSALNLLAS